MQKGAQRLNGVRVRRFHRLQRLQNCGRLIVRHTGRSLHIGTVAAGAAHRHGILPGGRQQHEFMGKAAAHHAGIRCNGNHLRQACPGKNALVGAVAARVITFQVLLGSMKRICVLHREFPHTDEAAAGTGLIAELGLDLIDHKGIPRSRPAVFPHELHSGFLVCHAQHHGSACAVLETQQLASHAHISARFLPQRAGQHHRHGHLLSFNRIHLFADDLLQLAGDAAQGRILGKDTVCDAFHITAAHHQRVAFDDTARRPFPKTFPHQFVQLHIRLLLCVRPGRTVPAYCKKRPGPAG